MFLLLREYQTMIMHQTSGIFLTHGKRENLSVSGTEALSLTENTNMVRELKKESIPSIHFGTGNAGLLKLMTEDCGDVVSLDWRIALDSGWQSIGSDVGVQGNLDPVLLMAPWPVLKQRAEEILDAAAGRPGHIFNLGHGILPSTPEDSVRALTEFVHECSTAKA